jgi:CRISPR-associated protein Csb2
MSAQLRISVRFLDGTFHGRGIDGEPEWPPSPLRLFQALTNAAARLYGDGIGAQNAVTLRWVEALPHPPEIFAASQTEAVGYQLYVPDNVGDLVAKQWSAGKFFDNQNHPIDISGYRTEKQVRPLRLSGDAVVHYLWPLDAAADYATHQQNVVSMARAVSRLGWGIDLVVTDAAVETRADSNARLSGERWFPDEAAGGTSLRVPVTGTLHALEERHAAFLGRIRHLDDGGMVFAPVPPIAPTAFRVVTYRRETDPVRPPFAIFALRQLDDSGFRAFDPARRGLHVAAMLRHIAGGADIARSLGWNEAQTGGFVHGHTDKESSIAPGPRLLFIPIPSIEYRGQGKEEVVGAIRRVLITAQGPLKRDEFRRLVQRLDGLELIGGKSESPASMAFLSRLPDSDKLTNANYLASSATWATVTPVILPGHDDPRKLRQRLHESSGLSAEEKNALVARLDQRIDHLLRKALLQAGYSATLTHHADIEWRGSGYLPGTDLASRYMAGDQHRRFRKLHVRMQFRDEHGQPLSIPGPLCIGGGRFSGTGLFAALA